MTSTGRQVPRPTVGSGWSPWRRCKSAPTTTTAQAPTLPEGYLLVPIEAWQAALAQLAHLHQAGQQLAKAQERAARAETTAASLREHQDVLRHKVAELRQRLDEQAKISPHQPQQRRWWQR